MSDTYVRDYNLQVAMSEYNPDLTKIGTRVQTQDFGTIGYLAKIYDNENGHGEQIYVIVPDKEDIAHPEQAEHIIVLMRGSTGPMEYEPKGLLKDVTGLSLPIGLSPEQEALVPVIRNNLLIF